MNTASHPINEILAFLPNTTGKGKPWAYSGAIDVSDCATAKEVMLKAGLNFNVAKCGLVGKMHIVTGKQIGRAHV